MNNTPNAGKNRTPMGARPKKESQHRINEHITAQTVRVVGEHFEPKIVSLREALAIADQYELDLVEISPNTTPPVCKVMDYQKYLYEQKKKAKGSIKTVKAWLTKKGYVPVKLRIKVAFIWTTVTISDFKSGGISDDLFIFPRNQYKDWKFVDKRND